MLAELKDKSQITIPKSVVNDLGLQRGDMFDIVVENGAVMLIPVVVYPKKKVEELEKLASEAKTELKKGQADLYNNINDLLDALHG